MVIAQPRTHTLSTAHSWSTIGSALIIAYRCHYRIHSRPPCLSYTHSTRRRRASRSDPEYEYSWLHSGGINLIRCGIVAKVPKIAVASSSYEHKVYGIRITKKFAAQSFALVRVVDGRLVIPREGEHRLCSLIIL
jgi:hypothetical protein